MIPYEPHPILFNIGPFALRYYSLAYLGGFLALYIALRRSAWREHADDLTIWAALGVLIGGRLGYVFFYAPALLISDIPSIFKIWQGGMSFHGGLIGAVSAVVLFTRSRKLAFLSIADTVTIPALVGIVLGRIANFLNGELVGTVTTVPWCVVFPGYAGCRHPSPLYEALYTLVILGVLLVLQQQWKRKQHAPRPGTVFALFLILYGVCRTLVTMLRDDPRILGLSTGQWLSVATGIAGCILLWWLAQQPTTDKKRRTGKAL